MSMKTGVPNIGSILSETVYLGTPSVPVSRICPAFENSGFRTALNGVRLSIFVYSGGMVKNHALEKGTVIDKFV